MDYKNIKVGDIVEIFCTGLKVSAKVIELNNDGFKTEHKPVNWGNDVYTTTFAHARPLHPVYDPKTVKLIPHCFYLGEPIIQYNEVKK